MTALTAVSALIDEGARLLDQGDSYYARAGAKFLEAREAAGGYTTLYRATLRKCGVGESTERRAVQFAHTPAAAVVNRQKDVARKRESRARTSERGTTSTTKDLSPPPGWTPPAPMSKGELHEAVAHWKAYHARANKAYKAYRAGADKTDDNDWWMYRNSAFATFESLVAQSNLPALTGMTPSQIVALIR